MHLWPRKAPSSFHVLAKPAGAICNLDCRYCFFLPKESLYSGSKFRMGNDTLEAHIRQVIESQRTPLVTIAWQGDEPTFMGLDFSVPPAPWRGNWGFSMNAQVD